MSKPSMPTYLSAAETLERKTGSGWKLAGWTVARTFLIAPPILLFTPKETHKKVWLGAILGSTFISLLAMLRIFNAGSGLTGAHRTRRQLRGGTRSLRA